jgi:hypothetical protein
MARNPLARYVLDAEHRPVETDDWPEWGRFFASEERRVDYTEVTADCYPIS